MGIVNSKTFRSGNSEAVRLPREVAFGADIAVTIERNGDVLTIRPAVDAAEEKRKLSAMIAALRALGPVGEIEQRPPFEAPDRPGL
jgi:antitoxin VapB